MKKILLLIFGLVILLGACGGGYYYYYYGRLDNDRDTRPPKDLTGIIVPPIEVSMKGNVFEVPDATSTKVTLTLILPSTKYDYPMGKFTIEGSATEGTLAALDNFTTSFENNVRAVPMVVKQGGGEFYYLAILSGENMEHIASLPIGDRIIIQKVIREGDKISVNYLVHAKEEAMTDIPSVDTTAIINIATKEIVQAGRDPKNEVVVVTKNFAGEYLWKDTKMSGGEVLVPSVPEVYNIVFSANRISVGTDCDIAGAEFVPPRASSSEIMFTNFNAVRKVCHADLNDTYFDMIKKITSFSEVPDGTLTFSLSDNSVMIFEPKVKILPTASNTASSTQ